MEGFVSIVVMTASMLVIGWFVWGRLKRQEDADPEYREKLEADDVRAREGREEAAGIRRAPSAPSGPPSDPSSRPPAPRDPGDGESAS